MRLHIVGSAFAHKIYIPRLRGDMQEAVSTFLFEDQCYFFCFRRLHLFLVDKALEINQNNAFAWYGKGANLAFLNKHEEALHCLD